MILDEQALFSKEQAVTASAASTNVIKVNGDIGKGEPVEILAQVVAAFATCTSVKVGVQTDDAENFSNAVTLAETGAIAVASLVAGYKFPIKFLPKGIKKYLRLYYTVAGSNATTGKITAGIVDGSNEGHHIA
ncbi:MAG: hypothetical protein DKM22_04270 [Candidatus Melainabacteria bacterium]|nr:MAG: hypothetical protein DKM22_04270 [Candidatus Melainabacteria bacterium]